MFPPSPGATFHCRPIPQGYVVVMVDDITQGFEELRLEHPTGDEETQLGLALKTSILWRKKHIKLLNFTAPASQLGTLPPRPPPLPPASDQATLPPAPTREGGSTLPPFPPAPARPSRPPPPSPPRKRRRNTDTAAPATPTCHRSPPPAATRLKKRKKTTTAAPAVPASRSTTRGGRQYKFGPSSLKPLEKLPYERCDEENQKISEGQVNDFFQSVKAKRHPPPEEKIDSVKAKGILDALTRAPPPPPQSNYDRVIERTYKEAERSGSTCTDQRLVGQRRGKQMP